MGMFNFDPVKPKKGKIRETGERLEIMDWAAFFKDNSQSIFTLAGVFLGSIITFLISYLNNRFQARERDKDREEQRREAKIQAKVKWIERDILKTMDSMETMLKLYSDFVSLANNAYYIQFGRDSNILSDDESKKRIDSFFNGLQTIEAEIDVVRDTMGRLVFSFPEQEIRDSFIGFAEAIRDAWQELSKYLENRVIEPYEKTGKIEKITVAGKWAIVSKKAGELQRVLREKLISLRDT